MSQQYLSTIQKLLDDPWCTRNTWRVEFLTGIEIWIRRGDPLTERQLTTLLGIEEQMTRLKHLKYRRENEL